MLSVLILRIKKLAIFGSVFELLIELYEFQFQNINLNICQSHKHALISMYFMGIRIAINGLTYRRKQLDRFEMTL